MNCKKRAIVLGKGLLAIKVANWFHENYDLQLVVPDIPEPSWSESLSSWCEEKCVPYINSGDYRDIKNVEDADIVVSVFYGKKISQDFISKCKKIINLHNSPLPKYRGVRPINWALENGETSHGVTIHDITAGLDEGSIYSQCMFSIYPEIDEVFDVYNRCLDFGWALFKNTIDKIDKIKPKEQNHSEATYYSFGDAKKLKERIEFFRK